MTDQEAFGDDEIAVVTAADGSSTVGIARRIIVVVATLVLVGGVYSWASGRDASNSAVVSQDADVTMDSTTTEVATTTTESATSVATTEPFHSATSTTELDPEGGPTPGDSPAGISCKDRRLPSLLGVTPHNAGAKLAACGTQFDPYSGPTFHIFTTSEPCASDPSQVGLIASQSPSAGSTFGGPPVRIEVAVYQDCASTVPPTDFVSPYTFPPDFSPPTTDETTTTLPAGP